MSRSSIFNFESLEGFMPRRPKGLLLAAAIVLCLEIGLRLAPDKWLFVSYSRPEFYVFMEQEVLPKFSQPQIAILGTSHAADAIVPDELDAALGLPPYSTANLGIFGSRSNEWLDMYRRNRAKLSKLKLLIVASDEWSFSSGAGADEHLSLYGSLADRWNYVQDSDSPAHAELNPEENKKRAADKLDAQRLRRNRLLTDYVFRMRVRLPDLPLALAKSLRLGKKRSPVFDKHHMVRSDRAQSAEAEDVKDPRNYHERIRAFYKHFDSHPLYMGYVEQLVELAKADGVKVLLLQLPNRRSYQNEVDKLFGAEYEQHLRAFHALADKLKVPCKSFKYPEEIEMDGAMLHDTDYVDYCHMAMSGAELTTTWLTDFIKRERLLEK
jgi:hypothetical protein